MTLECAREQDVLDAIASGRWPDRCESELRDHVSRCAICADVAEIAGPLAEDRERAWAEADVPPATIVWWRAQMRAREEAARVAGRPIALVEGVALVALAITAFALTPAALEWLLSAAVTIRSGISWITPRAVEVSQAFALATGSSVPLLVLSAWAVLAPLVLYLALVDE
jgi:hypothetical protein